LTFSIDIDDLFNEESVKAEPTTPSKAAPASQQEVKPDIAPSPTPTKSKPKKGRLVSNETPLEDFRALIEGEGDVFRKAIQDLGQVVKENVAASFSRQAFPLAIECLKSMRETALMYEEVETYNE
jgi:ATP-dependent DNA helicase 2 subunit 2